MALDKEENHSCLNSKKTRKGHLTDEVAHKGYEWMGVQITEQKRPLDQEECPALSVAEDGEARLKREKGKKEERLMRKRK